MRWRRSTITAIPLPPHQLVRQRFNRFPEAPVTWHIEQLVDDLLQRRRINVTPERLRNFPDRVVGRRHARRSCYRAGTRALRSALTRLDLARARSGRLIGAFSQCGELLSPHSELFADLGSYGDLRQLAPSLGLLSKEAGIGHRRIPAAVLFTIINTRLRRLSSPLNPGRTRPRASPPMTRGCKPLSSRSRCGQRTGKRIWRRPQPLGTVLLFIKD
jgi:hypothetical protein